MKRRLNFHSLVPSTVLFFLSASVSQETLFMCQTMRNIGFLNLILHSGVQYSVVFPFSICQSGNSVYVSDYEKHCLSELDIAQRTFTPVAGKYETEGQTDGPLDKATLSHPASIAVRSAVIYTAEHPSVYQSAIRLCYSLEGLVKFQSAWKEITSSMSLVSKREALQNPEKARQTKT